MALWMPAQCVTFCPMNHHAPFSFLIVASLIALTPPPVSAQQDTPFCQEIWLSRNTIMDRAGQCFASPLGRAVFDNSDCVESDIRLNPLDAEIVRVAQEIEAWAGCAVDTDATRLMVEVLPFRARLMELFTVPVRIDSEHGCTGYHGPPITLHTGISTNMTVLGTVGPGQGFSLAHMQVRGGWEYLEVYDADGALLTHGWTQDMPYDFGNYCTFSAG